MHRVAILTFDHAPLFELACAVELFGLKRPEFDTWYQCDVISFDPGLLNTTANVLVKPKAANRLSKYSTLVIPGWPFADRKADKVLIKELLKFHASGKRIISFCTGAFLLAELGILDNRQATTHWAYADTFKTKFPEVEYVDDVLYVYDGQVGCSAGSASGIDLGIEIIRNDFGYKAANQVARRMVLSAHRNGGQSQFVETPVLEKPNQFSKSLDWAIKNLAKPLDINTLAEKANMSRRTFDRKFKSTLKLSPKVWLTNQRVMKAKELLENKQLSIEKIAELSGFETATTMRHHFRKSMSISPTQYRDQFCCSAIRAAAA